MTAPTLDRPTAIERATYSVPEAAARLGISIRHCADLVGEGRIPGAFRLGRRVLILREGVESLLDEARRSLDSSGN